MNRSQHSSTDSGVLNSLMFGDPGAPEVIQTDEAAKSLMRPTDFTASSNSVATKCDDDGNKEDSWTAAKTPPASVHDANVVSAAAKERRSSVVVCGREGESSDDDVDEESGSRPHQLVDDNDNAAAATTDGKSLDAATKRQLLAMLPSLMSAANYKRLVDEGHLKYAEQVDAGDVSQSSQQPNIDDKKPNTADEMLVKQMPDKSASPPVGDKHVTDEGTMMRMPPRDFHRDASTLSSPEQRESGLAVYTCHICDFVCKYSNLIIIVLQRHHTKGHAKYSAKNRVTQMSSVTFVSSETPAFHQAHYFEGLV
jgi:hypothetical protein